MNGQPWTCIDSTEVKEMGKQLRYGILSFLGIVLLILDSKTALTGASNGIEICIKTVIPSLLPFFVLSNVLMRSLYGSKAKFLHLIEKLFHIPHGAGILPVCFFLGGYPVGAQNVGKLYQTNVISKHRAETLLAYCNNAGPAFIFGMISCLFDEKWIPWVLWIIHIVSAFLVSRWFPCDERIEEKSFSLDVSISEVVSSSMKTIGQVCVWVILFRIIINFLSRWVLWVLPTTLQILIAGSLELANGCIELIAIKSSALRFILCSALLSFGGLCVIMQTESVTNGLRLRYYFYGKTLQTIFSIFLSTAFILQQWLLLVLFILLFLLVPKIILKKCSIPNTLRV